MKSQIYSQNNSHYIALVIKDATGIEHVVSFSSDGISLTERANGESTTIFGGH